MLHFTNCSFQVSVRWNDAESVNVLVAGSAADICRRLREPTRDPESKRLRMNIDNCDTR